MIVINYLHLNYVQRKLRLFQKNIYLFTNDYFSGVDLNNRILLFSIDTD